MFNDKREDLLTKQKSAEAELNSKGSQYEKGARDYQEKVQKGLVTRATAAEMEQALLQQQQELVDLRDKLQSNLDGRRTGDEPSDNRIYYQISGGEQNRI